MIVADANILLALVLEQPEHDKAVQLLQADPVWMVPSLWRYEVAHVLVRLLRGGQLDPARVQAIQAYLEALFGGRELVIGLAEASAAAKRHGLSSGYDAAYVALAERLGCPLVTLDREVLRKTGGVARGI